MIKKMAENKKTDTEGKLATLVNIVSMEGAVDEEHQKLCDEAGLTIFTLEELVEKGAAYSNKQDRSPGPDDTYMLSYTSGTTGDPKGVKLTHKMILGCGFAINTRFAAGGVPII